MVLGDVAVASPGTTELIHLLAFGRRNMRADLGKPNFVFFFFRKHQDHTFQSLHIGLPRRIPAKASEQTVPWGGAHQPATHCTGTRNSWISSHPTHACSFSERSPNAICLLVAFSMSSVNFSSHLLMMSKTHNNNHQHQKSYIFDTQFLCYFRKTFPTIWQNKLNIMSLQLCIKSWSVPALWD